MPHRQTRRDTDIQRHTERDTQRECVCNLDTVDRRHKLRNTTSVRRITSLTARRSPTTFCRSTCHLQSDGLVRFSPCNERRRKQLHQSVKTGAGRRMVSRSQKTGPNFGSKCPLARPPNHAKFHRCRPKPLQFFTPFTFLGPREPHEPKFTSLGGDVQEGPLHQVSKFRRFG